MSLNATSYPIDIDEMHVPSAETIAKRRAARREMARIAEIRRRLESAKIVSYADASPEEDFSMDMLFQFDYTASSEGSVRGRTKVPFAKKIKGKYKKNKSNKKAGKLTRVEDEERDGFVIVNSFDYIGTENHGQPSGKSIETRTYALGLMRLRTLRLTKLSNQSTQFSARKHIRLPSDRDNRRPWDAFRVIRGVLGFGWD
ncbi:hypothetical protein ASPVEDRAFT_32414 [Aspergillus versicolor CBS 583.65]|uniref:Uncharacterized protein n=1 Tax=Aspergillus versicolor CBS 583.65 TaxID=1036611 RepID=A0A1L9PX27_ASPVE|nr:uncharacterized protein ASPVEDRAFT_32414 [Aspergillus versicolor CBS 583.65]OJJ06089.1 hypothetical protein ASPVEDRAFT_32414 [Aspergillus versicolor CBS 583.65]